MLLGNPSGRKWRLNWFRMAPRSLETPSAIVLQTGSLAWGKPLSRCPEATLTLQR